MRLSYNAKLGDLVRDRISGYEGIAVAVCSYLQGCDRMTVQPKVKEDGVLPEAKSFDAPDLEVLKRSAVSYDKSFAERRMTGGPAKFMPESRPVDKRR